VKPEEALAAARAEVERIKAAGGYREVDADRLRIHPVDRVGYVQLMEWAVIDPDVSQLRSTRRHGKPITWVKRLMWRSLQQYLNDLVYQQSRFNIHILRRILELESRVDELEGRPRR
jgi:hypothetical protein